MSRAAWLSWLVVLVAGAMAAVVVARAFALFGSDVTAAGLGAGLWLAMSAVALCAALCALWDLVFLLSTGRHLVLKPLISPPRTGLVVWLPVLTIALGVLAGYTVFR